MIVSKRFFANTFCILLVFTFASINVIVKAEDIPESCAPDSHSQEINNNSSEPQRAPPREAPKSQVQQNNPDESKKVQSGTLTAEKEAEKKKKEAEKKPKKSSQKAEKSKKSEKIAEKADNKNEEPPKNEEQPVQNQITLPDLSDSVIQENDITIPSQVKSSEEKLIKGVISWIMILSGIALIIWVIINNRRV